MGSFVSLRVCVVNVAGRGDNGGFDTQGAVLKPPLRVFAYCGSGGHWSLSVSSNSMPPVQLTTML